MLKTRVTELFGIKYPIIQGSMLWLARAELVSAVSNAGGLGILSSSTFPTAGELRQEIRKTRSLTDKPFGVNITLMPTARPVNYEELISAAIEEGVGIFETAGRSPEPHMKLFKDGRAKVLHKCARVRDARSAERVGVDAVAIVGFEAAGHPGMEDVTSLVRIPMTADSVKIPVVAAGGIADGRGLVAALALGAEGVLMGTRFMACRECNIHPRIREWMLQATETETMMIERSIKNAARVMKTDFSQKVLDIEDGGATLEELLPYIGGERSKRCYVSGETDAVIACGQAVGLIHDVPSAGDVIERMMSEARGIVQRLRNSGI